MIDFFSVRLATFANFASAGVRAEVGAERGHAVDHPVPLSFPEGRYLMFMLLRVL